MEREKYERKCSEKNVCMIHANRHQLLNHSCSFYSLQFCGINSFVIVCVFFLSSSPRSHSDFNVHLFSVSRKKNWRKKKNHRLRGASINSWIAQIKQMLDKIVALNFYLWNSTPDVGNQWFFSFNSFQQKWQILRFVWIVWWSVSCMRLSRKEGECVCL